MRLKGAKSFTFIFTSHSKKCLKDRGQLQYLGYRRFDYLYSWLRNHTTKETRIQPCDLLTEMSFFDIQENQ